jgi:hypothetical protein
LPIFDWGSSLFFIFTPPGPAGHTLINAGGEALSIRVNNNFRHQKEREHGKTDVSRRIDR